MASDIPIGHHSSWAMARSLATYINCPHEIRKRVSDHYGQPPSIAEITRMRAKHLRVAVGEPMRANEGYYPGDHARSLDEVNQRFLMRLTIERALSERVIAA